MVDNSIQYVIFKYGITNQVLIQVFNIMDINFLLAELLFKIGLHYKLITIIILLL